LHPLQIAVILGAALGVVIGLTRPDTGDANDPPADQSDPPAPPTPPPGLTKEDVRELLEAREAALRAELDDVREANTDVLAELRETRAALEAARNPEPAPVSDPSPAPSPVDPTPEPEDE